MTKSIMQTHFLKSYSREGISFIKDLILKWLSYLPSLVITLKTVSWTDKTMRLPILQKRLFIVDMFSFPFHVYTLF